MQKIARICAAASLVACFTCGTPKAVDTCQSVGIDADNDGYGSCVDCDDQNPAVHPGAAEQCNGRDDNCDGVVDEGCAVDGGGSDGGTTDGGTTDGGSGDGGQCGLPVDCSLSACHSQPCSDGNTCTAGDTCSGGVCAGTPVSCDDANPCTTDSCDPMAGCVHTINNASCDDGNPCTVDTCDSISGCANTPVADGTACGTSQTCKAGACI